MRAGFQSTENGCVVILEVDAVDFIPGNHDVIHRHLFKVENIDQHIPVTSRNQAARFAHNRSEFFLRKCVLARRVCLEAKKR